MRVRFVLVLFGLCSFVLTAQAQNDPAQRVTLKKGDHIFFYGDSLTEQARGPKGWVTIVRDTLKKSHPDLGLEVSTFAIGGYCIVDRVKRVEKEVLDKKPTIVVIQGGVPDALRYKGDQFKTGLEDLIARLEKANVRVVVCSCTSLGEKHDGTNRIDKNLDEFAEVARQVAKDKKLPLNDLRMAFKEYWKKNNKDNKASGILTNDGNHFNDTGNQFVAEQMLKMFSAGDGKQKAKLDLTPETFGKLHTLICPHDNEWRHLKVEWLTDVVAARKKAVAEDKPIVICYTGGAGYNEPLGVC
jgi:lysophospholipase L1-like esterase